EYPGVFRDSRPRRGVYIRGFAARADRYQNVTRAYQGVDLAGKNRGVLVVIAPAGDRRRIEQVVCGDARPIGFVSRYELLDQMHRVTGRSTIAARIEMTATPEGVR